MMLKQDYYSEEGITLVELLAALSLFSIVVLLIGSVHIFAQRQFRQQSDRIEVSSEVRLVMSQFESDIRSIDSGTVYWDEDTLFIGSEEISYRLSDQKILRNDSVIADNISDFSVEFDSDRNQVDVRVTGTQKNQRQPQTLKTTIYLRE